MKKLSLKNIIKESGLQSTTMVPSKGQDWSKEDLEAFEDQEKMPSEEVGIDGLQEAKIPQDKIDEICRQTALKYSGNYVGAAQPFEGLLKIAHGAAERLSELEGEPSEVDYGVYIDRRIREAIGI